MGFWSRSPEPAKSDSNWDASEPGPSVAALGAPDAPGSPPSSASSSSAPSNVWIPPDSELEEEKTQSLHIALPSNLIILPSVAGLVGFFLGARRGAAAARLRYLAENAHRQPTTVQGWYFYLKTRNYRMLMGGMRSGAKYALGLGTATGLYVALDEGAGWVREVVFEGKNTPLRAGPTNVNPDRWGWRKGEVRYEDGIVAGSVLAMVVGLGYRLPTPVLIRGLVMGTVAGGVYSGLQIAQDRVAALRREEEAAKAAAAAAEALAKRERRLAQGLPAEADKTDDEHKRPEDRNFFEKIGAWARGRDAEHAEPAEQAKQAEKE